ncbi:MAG TPA: Hsp33 family molecular chaperone HslO [Syntrophomonadaceae bacterium]|jgi:molecular chaperone Hsp33|nr:Hsp33 family molecular chaperone HslO [Syntrophomonadaceae bacterium]
MAERDRQIKVIDQDKNIRLFLARTTNLVEEARQRHNTSATAAAALGRVMTAAVMMASDLKGLEDSLTIRVKGNGPAGTIIATADTCGGVRGFITNPTADLPETAFGKLAVGELVGTQGFLEVVKDLGLKQPFSGHIELVSGEIAEDLAHYFLVSEQVPALVSLGVLVAPNLNVQAAGGLIVQAMPGARDEILKIIEDNILRSGTISSLMDSYDSLEEIVPMIMEGVDYEIIENNYLQFQCKCNRDKLLGVLRGLSSEERRDMQQDEEIEVVCNFCQQRYHYKPDELEDQKN